jgi:hypothetical protein
MPTKSTKTDALAIPIESQFLVPTKDLGFTADDFGGDDEAITYKDLDRIAWPASGGRAWEVEELDEIVSMSEMEVVVLHSHASRSYFAASYDEGGEGPPECSSMFGKQGIGVPGNRCIACPKAQFQGDERPECRERRTLYVLFPGDMLPRILSIPPTSMREWDRFYSKLKKMRIPCWGRVLKFSLEKSKTKGGNPYSKLIISASRPVTEDEKKRIRELRGPFMESINSAAEDELSGTAVVE